MLCSVEAKGEGRGIDGVNGCVELLWYALDQAVRADTDYGKLCCAGTRPRP